MKIEITRQPSKRIEFPCLMENEQGVVVFFTAEFAGLCLKSTKSITGGFYTNWTSARGHEWKPFKGKIILEND